jgi:hypothetical protein
MKQYGALLRCPTVAPSAWWYIHLHEIREVSRYDGSMKSNFVKLWPFNVNYFYSHLVVIMSTISNALVIIDGQ